MSTSNASVLNKAERIISVSKNLVRHYEQREAMAERLDDGWFNEQGATRARENIARLDVRIAVCLDVLEDIIKDRP